MTGDDEALDGCVTETTTVAKQDRGEADDIAVRLEILRLWRQMARSDLVIDALLRVGGGQMDITAQRCAVFCLRDEVGPCSSV